MEMEPNAAGADYWYHLRDNQSVRGTQGRDDRFRVMVCRISCGYGSALVTGRSQPVGIGLNWCIHGLYWICVHLSCNLPVSVFNQIRDERDLSGRFIIAST